MDGNSHSFSLEVKWKLRYSSKHVSEHMNVVLLSANCTAEYMKQLYNHKAVTILKFIHSEKATKFSEISTSLLSYTRVQNVCPGYGLYGVKWP